MIIGIGNDLVDIRRIEKLLNSSGKRFIARCFTSEEQAKAEERKKSPNGQSSIYAKRFAAKEACAKALGVGFSNGVCMSDIAVSSDKLGRPFLKLSGGAQKRLKKITPKGKKAMLHLSISDEYPYAQAFVVIEAV